MPRVLLCLLLFCCLYACSGNTAEISVTVVEARKEPAVEEHKEPAASYGGRCTGSKSCTACKNCKYCKHCSKQGKSCSVCK